MGKIAIQAFGTDVIHWSANLTQEKADAHAQAQGLPGGNYVVSSSNAEFFRHADVVSLRYVLSERSRGIVSADELASLKPAAVIANASRGPLIDEPALLEALEAGRIRGAALDVFDPMSWARAEGVKSCSVRTWVMERRISSMDVTERLLRVQRDGLMGKSCC